MKQTSIEYIRNFEAENPRLLTQVKDAEAAIERMSACYLRGGKFLICGNGGSASDCEHMVGELMKGFLKKRPITSEEIHSLKKETDTQQELDWMSQNLQRGIPAISLVSQSSLMTAFTNDSEPQLLFAQQVMGYGTEKDIYIGFSTSGNSANIVYGAKAAKSKGMDVIAFTGREDSKLSRISSVVLKSNDKETYKVQEEHIKLYHLICAVLENEAFER